MQNAQNNFTVENLVAKYRDYVNKHCPKSWECDGLKQFESPISPYANADEQLLVTLYKRVAGKDVDQQILSALVEYGEKFYGEALSEDEFSWRSSPTIIL